MILNLKAFKNENMSTCKQLQIQIILSRNVKPLNVRDVKEVVYYKDEGGKYKCIKFFISNNEDVRIIQLCDGVETLITENNKLFNISRNIMNFEIKFKKVSKNVNNAIWCIEVFSLLNSSLTKRSAWIKVMSKRKIPANIRLDPEKIIEFKKRKREVETNEESNVNASNKRIKKIVKENSLLRQENSHLKQQIYELNKTAIIQNFSLAMLEIHMKNQQSINDEFTNIPLDPEISDVNSFEWLKQ